MDMRTDLGRTVAQLTAIIDSVPTAIIMVDAAGRIELVNTHAERLFGYSRSELQGEVIDLLVPFRFRSAHPEHRAHFLRAPSARPMGTGRDLYGLHKDGREFPIEIGLNPITTDAGNFVVSAIVDISDRKRMEARFRATVESAPTAMVMIDQSGTIVLVNAEFERMFGYARDELRTQKVESLIPQRLRAGHPGMRTQYFAAPESRRMGQGRELFGLRKDGSEFPIEIGLNPVQTDEGSFVLAAIVDISERRRQETELHQANEELAREVAERTNAEHEIRRLNAELEDRVRNRTAQLEAANSELEAFSFSVSHDLRAPLRHIDGYAQMLREDSGQLDEQTRRYIDMIGVSARRMGLLIDDLLAFSRLGRNPIKRAPVDMTALVERALQEARTNKGQSAQVSVEPLPPAYADPSLMYQVWVNLLSNALKYSAGRGAQARVVVSGESGGHYNRYRVRDNGVGFDMRYADKLFGVFQRLHAHDQFEGTGVGLAIVRRVIDRHGGKISAESEIDRGATFTIELPAAGADALDELLPSP
jgi:PAS domain S-box-containing protein